uniref:Uncharacterized protein n=1 Tax=Chromera velia CCMP2878 TaxID=1169474 RepID=A0A0G4I935_9ALVE|eukprot:Cvel_12137.t1-p1 / transcript=Cvel_12137.t1 / gene=Cvel_12137 / organism=Chromera_velia_CCMP2878 / gene_product=hypothetical protein / transcript_product=hypothetical protein / location=Cvel_scaffold782:20500-22484(-) / protein_length=123 / sequence_SO=supercontig / SO=protein_coding / is_pseudo=false
MPANPKTQVRKRTLSSIHLLQGQGGNSFRELKRCMHTQFRRLRLPGLAAERDVCQHNLIVWKLLVWQHAGHAEEEKKKRKKKMKRSGPEGDAGRGTARGLQEETAEENGGGRRLARRRWRLCS